MAVICPLVAALFNAYQKEWFLLEIPTDAADQAGFLETWSVD